MKINLMTASLQVKTNIKKILDGYIKRSLSDHLLISIVAMGYAYTN